MIWHAEHSGQGCVTAPLLQVWSLGAGDIQNRENEKLTYQPVILFGLFADFVPGHVPILECPEGQAVLMSESCAASKGQGNRWDTCAVCHASKRLHIEQRHSHQA